LEYLETILKIFPVDTHNTERIHLTDTSQETRLYKVDAAKSQHLDSIEGRIYLIDTPAGQKIACHPHIVAEELSVLCFEAANEFASTLKELNR